jgi:hypothetical protein
MRRFAISIVAALAPIPASAHPDHSAGGAVGLVHYLTDPFHVAASLVTIGAVVLVLGTWRARRRRSIVVP